MTDMRMEDRVPQPASEADAGGVAAATEQAKEVAHQAGDELGTVLDATKEQARGLVGTARERVAGEADSATTRAADAMEGTARDLADLAAGRGSPDTQVAQLVRQAGDRVDRAASQLRDRGYQGVAEDVSRWARAHPGAFLAAAAGAGFVIGRVFRAADTQGVVDAAKGGPAASGDALGADRPPALTAADPSLFAEERRSDGPEGGMGSPAVDIDGPIDLTAEQPGPVAGV